LVEVSPQFLQLHALLLHLRTQLPHQINKRHHRLLDGWRGACPILWRNVERQRL
jgi:hypothetical protein